MMYIILKSKFFLCDHFSTTVYVCCFRIPNLVNQRPPHLKFRGFPTLMASRFSKGADLIPHYPLLTFNLWPTHNLSPQNIGIQKDPKSWSLKICSGITSLCYNKVTQNMALYVCSCGTTLLEFRYSLYFQQQNNWKFQLDLRFKFKLWQWLLALFISEIKIWKNFHFVCNLPSANSVMTRLIFYCNIRSTSVACDLFLKKK